MNEDQVYGAAEREMGLYRAEVTRVLVQRDEARAERDKAYRERAALVAFLAACYPAEIVEQPGKFADEWPVVYVDTPAGQLSWHLSRNDLGLFGHVRQYIDGTSPWDGHTTEEKYERLAGLIPHAPGMRHEAAPDPAALRLAVITEVREASSCNSDDGDQCERCCRHADRILAAVKGTS